MIIQKEHLRSLRLADLELFIIAAKLKNLSRAAESCHLSQSAASAAIQRVETGLGMELCLHKKKSFDLTTKGKSILPLLEEWLSKINQIVSIEPALHMRIATTHALGQVAVPSLLSLDTVRFLYMRPDQAYHAVIEGRAELALVLDNAIWKGLDTLTVGEGLFQIYAKQPRTTPSPILLPEDQLESMSLQQSWKTQYHSPLPVKSRIPSWSLIADICSRQNEAGFLPEFLGKHHKLKPVCWQPLPTRYKVLALYDRRKMAEEELAKVLHRLKEVFQ